MRKRISIVLMGLMFCMAVSAQGEANDSFFDRFMLELGVDAGTKQHDIAPLGVGVNVGYNLSSRFYVYARYQGMMGLYDNDHSRTYFKTQNLGGGLGFTFHKDTWKNGAGLWDLRAQVTNSIGNVDWKNTSYDLGVYWRIKSAGAKVAPMFGIGFRHINSHTTGIRDCNCFYGTIGFSL